ncbi:MAG: co-chaperone GroES [Candidatus Marinimicrobia bacterium]|nr:co-chaperone GroES [Candidatus Neomarinimicrobiota bacterium]|tara:strand:+ start:97134 stop:97424 length:291 start_codon:yes stop_codon:yes gene_type:complete
MALSLKPLSDRVVVEAAPAEEVSSGGIILPDTAQEKPQQGTVVAVGPGKTSDSGTLVKLTVKKNDKVLFGKYSGSDITIDGKDYMIMRESDILAII